MLIFLTSWDGHAHWSKNEGDMPERLSRTFSLWLPKGALSKKRKHTRRHAERLAAGVLCSIVTVDDAGLIHPLAGLSIPAAYSAALDGIAIGPGVGSCGTAAFLRKAVAVEEHIQRPLVGSLSGACRDA